MNLNNLVNDAMQTIQKDGFVEDVIKKQLEVTIKKVVEEYFGSYGDFRKELEKQVKEQLQIDMNKLGISGYNLMVLNEVKSQLETAIHIQGVQKIKENMEKMLVGIKPEYKLSELVEAMKKDENEDHDKDGEEIGFMLERSDHGYTHIYIDPESDSRDSWRSERSKYSYKYQLHLDNEGRVYNSKIDSHELSKNNEIMTSFYDFDKLMFQIFATGAKIVVDEDEVDTYYGEDY
ncbi:hypothetical protein BK143_09600 [Paenibacillus peoriae]|uniref:hypothetical protein n=1 Tax=Paenibacillus peoriae TaxID=59893 RepID=UPI00096F63EF|nr:hypothetical protein [Paenibacillus peoriae]OMF72512.1 hypothetical protein BK143_09600 [Paenibacillus peoriae]